MTHIKVRVPKYEQERERKKEISPAVLADIGINPRVAVFHFDHNPGGQESLNRDRQTGPADVPNDVGGRGFLGLDSEALPALFHPDPSDQECASGNEEIPDQGDKELDHHCQDQSMDRKRRRHHLKRIYFGRLAVKNDDSDG